MDLRQQDVNEAFGCIVATKTDEVRRVSLGLTKGTAKKVHIKVCNNIAREAAIRAFGWVGYVSINAWSDGPGAIPYCGRRMPTERCEELGQI